MSNTTAQRHPKHTIHHPSFLALMGTLLYDLYTLCIVLPLFILASILTALITTVGCRLGNGHFWGYYPGKWWSWFTIRLLFLPVKVEDKSGASKIKKTYDEARETLREGMSVVVFPEGARSFTGHMAHFRRGAFMLADELQLPVCPITINGSFDVMPRTKDWNFPVWNRLRLTIHEPIQPKGKGVEFEKQTMVEAYKAVMSGLDDKYQGFIENPDQ